MAAPRKKIEARLSLPVPVRRAFQVRPARKSNTLRAPIKRGLSQGGALHFYPLPGFHRNTCSTKVKMESNIGKPKFRKLSSKANSYFEVLKGKIGCQKCDLFCSPSGRYFGCAGHVVKLKSAGKPSSSLEGRWASPRPKTGSSNRPSTRN